MAAIPSTLDELRVPIESLNHYHRNARKGNVPEIVRSLKRLGQYRPVVANRGTLTGRPNEVLAGNHTLAGALSLGWAEIAATFVDVDDDTATRINVVDNRAGDLGYYDEAMLAEELSSLPDLEGTGYSDRDYAELMSGIGQTPGMVTEPGAPPASPKSRPGNLYRLGDHRLLCGDATDGDAIARLLDGAHPDLLFADPGDDRSLIEPALTAAAEFVTSGTAWYVWCGWRAYPESLAAIGLAGRVPSACLVWARGRSDTRFCAVCHPEFDGDHELCVFCKGETWEGQAGQSDLWDFPRDPGSRDSTQMPVALCERALECSAPGGGLVLDLFAGSGSMLLAAENLNRRAAMIEIEPARVDVIIDRWERHTGKKAK